MRTQHEPHSLRRLTYSQQVFTLSQALLLSVSGKTQGEIDLNSTAVYCYRNKENYVSYLLQIINSQLKEEILASSALSQLKVIVRNYLHQAKTSNLIEQHKLQLVKGIIPTSLNIAKISQAGLHYKYLKLFKDVISLSSQYAMVICPQVVQSINQNLQQQNLINLLPAYLNIVLGLYSDGKQAPKQYAQLVDIMLPLLYQFISFGDNKIQELYEGFNQSINQNQSFLNKYLEYKRKYEQILYLSIKLVSKVTIPTNNKNTAYIIQWIAPSLNRIQYIDTNFTLPLEQQRKGLAFNRNNMGNKGDDEFNYFHGKKWALKFINLVFTNKLSVKKQECKQIVGFYQNNLASMISIFKTVWSYQWPDRIQRQLLQCFQIFLANKGKQLALNHCALLSKMQKTILPPLMRLTKRQIDILNQNPIHFICQQNNINGKESMRMLAANIWIKISSLQNNENNSLLLIQSWFGSTIPQAFEDRDSGCFLLIHLKEVFRNLQKNHTKLALINKILTLTLEDLKNSFNYMKLLRALQLFTAYKSILSSQIVQYCKSIVMECFTRYNQNQQLNGHQIVLLLQCFKAFLALIKGDEQIKEEIGYENFKTVIAKGLTMVEKTCYDEFIKVVNSILEECINDASHFAQEIAEFLQNWFKSYAEKDIFLAMSNKEEYSSHCIEIAKGTLSIFETLIHFVRNGHQGVTKVIQREIISIIYYLFSRQSKNENDQQINQQALWLLKQFLKSSDKSKSINCQIMKICKVIILRLAGLHESIISQLKQRKQQQVFKKKIQQYNLYINCQYAAQRGFQPCVEVLRSFIRYLPYGQIVNIKDMKILGNQTNYTECLIYLPYRFYSNKEKDLTKTDSGRCFSLLMLIYYYEHHQQNGNNIRVDYSFNTFTLLIIKNTIALYRHRPQFAKYNVQLFCMWMLEVKQRFSIYFHKWSEVQMQQFMSSVFLYQRKNTIFGLQQIQTYEQEVRCILGIGVVVKLMSSQFMKNVLPFFVFSRIVKYAVEFICKRIEEEQMLQQLQLQDYSIPEEGELDYPQSALQPFSLRKMHLAKETGHRTHQRICSQSEEDSQDNVEDCMLFEQFEDEDLYSPLEPYNQRLSLLLSLHSLFTTDPQCYWQVLKKQGLREQIMTILQDCECLKQNSQHSYLTKLRPTND